MKLSATQWNIDFLMLSLLCWKTCINYATVNIFLQIFCSQVIGVLVVDVLFDLLLVSSAFFSTRRHLLFTWLILHWARVLLGLVLITTAQVWNLPKGVRQKSIPLNASVWSAEIGKGTGSKA